MDKIKKKIIKLAIKNGSDYAILNGFWNDYEVYAPIFWADGIFDIGLPEFILAKDNEIRWTKDNEWQQLLEEMEYVEDERILEITPVKIEPNTTIKSFKFTRGGRFSQTTTVEYKSLKNEKILYFKNFTSDHNLSPKSGKIKITDKNFEKYTQEMISYFHKNLGTNPNILDGEWYEFSATLSNGQKLKSQGYNFFPENYNKFIAYLEYLIEYNTETLKEAYERVFNYDPTDEEVEAKYDDEFNKWLDDLEI
jgi:hypothetical protein